MDALRGGGGIVREWRRSEAMVGQGPPYARSKASGLVKAEQVFSRQPVFVVPAKAGTQSACDPRLSLACGCATVQPAFAEGDGAGSQAFCSLAVRGRGQEGRA